MFIIVIVMNQHFQYNIYLYILFIYNIYIYILFIYIIYTYYLYNVYIYNGSKLMTNKIVSHLIPKDNSLSFVVGVILTLSYLLT
jgi:hypothetical protein